MIKIFSHLHSYQIPFVVIGGHAVNFHGYIRATEDHDIIFKRTAESEDALFQALQAINACWLSNDIDPQTGIEREVRVSREYLSCYHLMMLYTSMGYLDIFDYIPGFPNVAVDEVMESADSFHGISMVNLEWLKKMKMSTGRPKDLLDIENLP
ncbi:MAG: hypothetical protein JXX14_03750 [Deltaproteobacteria bacterium]|nr:hypothetical protein [Deltaproteobacteria bacterium]